MKNFLRNMASLIVVVAMNMAALIIVVAMSMTALIIVVAMITIFVAVIWTNRWFLIKKAIVILALIFTDTSISIRSLKRSRLIANCVDR